MSERYQLEPDADGWSICDRLTGRSAVLEQRLLRGLDFDEADQLLERMNRRASQNVA